MAVRNEIAADDGARRAVGRQPGPNVASGADDMNLAEWVAKNYTYVHYFCRFSVRGEFWARAPARHLKMGSQRLRRASRWGQPGDATQD